MYSLGPIYRFTVGGAGKGGGGGSPPSPAPWGQGRGVPLVARSFLSLGGPRRGELVSSGSGRPGGGCRLRGGVLAGRVCAPFFSSVGEEAVCHPGSQQPKAGRADSSIVRRPEPPTRVLGGHTPAARPANPRMGRAPGRPPAFMALETWGYILRNWMGHWCVTTEKIQAPQVTARGSPFPSTALVVRGDAPWSWGLEPLPQVVWGGLRPPQAGFPDWSHPFVGPHFSRLAVSIGPRTVPDVR